MDVKVIEGERVFTETMTLAALEARSRTLTGATSRSR